MKKYINNTSWIKAMLYTLLLLFSTITFGQTTVTLNQLESGINDHCVLEEVHFQPGYSYTPTGEEWMHSHAAGSCSFFDYFVINTHDMLDITSYSISGAGLNEVVNIGSEQAFYPTIPEGITDNIQIVMVNENITSTITIEMDESLNIVTSSLVINDGGIIKTYNAGNYFNQDLQGFHFFNLTQLYAELIFKGCLNDNNRNWTAAKFFDEDGNLVSSSKSYFNHLGNSTQAQVKNFTDNTVIATQTVYDAYGRSVLTTLPTPTYETSFCYKDDLIKAIDGSNYDYTQFDIPNYSTFPNIVMSGEVDKPNAVERSNKGSVGWYYSDNNTEEPYVATTYLPI